jgi:hypothetical protein
VPVVVTTVRLRSGHPGDCTNLIRACPGARVGKNPRLWGIRDNAEGRRQNVAKELRRAPVRVTLVDQRNHHQFQTLLYRRPIARRPPNPPGGTRYSAAEAQVVQRLGRMRVSLRLGVGSVAYWARSPDPDPDEPPIEVPPGPKRPPHRDPVPRRPPVEEPPRKKPPVREPPERRRRRPSRRRRGGVASRRHRPCTARLQRSAGVGWTVSSKTAGRA